MNQRNYTTEETKEVELIEKQDEKITEEKDYSYFANNNITQYKSDLAFKTLIDGFDQQLYVIPKYQRKYIWVKNQVENLAISLLRGLPIPPIYVYRNKKGQMEILDGQQRILSLFLYYKGKYIKNSTNTQIELQKIMADERLINNNTSFETLLEAEYPLKDVVYELKYREDNKDKIININYSELPIEIRRTVDFTTISVIEIKVDSDDQRNRILYKVFENLNSGGTELKNQELRNGVYQCEFYDMLHEINNTNAKWRTLYGEKHKHNRDVELLLRFSALEYYFKLIEGSIVVEHYDGSYPRLLNDFSDKVLHFDDETIKHYKKNIECFIEKIEITVVNRIPNLLLESLYLASIYVPGKYKIVNELYEKIITQIDYANNINNASSSKSKVKERLNCVYKALSEYVDGNKE